MKIRGQDNMALFLGINGGSSGCRGRLCDDAGNVLGQGEAAYPHPFATFRAEADAYTACLGAHAGRGQVRSTAWSGYAGQIGIA